MQQRDNSNVLKQNIARLTDIDALIAELFRAGEHYLDLGDDLIDTAIELQHKRRRLPNVRKSDNTRAP